MSPVTEPKPGALWRVLKELPLALLSPGLILLAAISLAINDLVTRRASRRHVRGDTQPDNTSAAIVIPNWNGRDLLDRYLPSVIEAAERVPGSEVLVVDNGSTDASAALVAERFPSVRLVALPENLGCGGG